MLSKFKQLKFPFDLASRCMSTRVPLHRPDFLKVYNDLSNISLHTPLIRLDLRLEQMGGFKICIADAPPSSGDSKSLWDSYVEVTYPIASNPSVRNHFTRPLVNAVRFGRIFEALDILAGETAYRHVLGRFVPDSPYTLVTASIDGISFQDSDISMTEDLTCRSYLCNVGKSSMEVRTEIFSGKKYIGDGFFTFVALDSTTQKAAKVPSLIPISDLDAKLLEEGKSRVERRKARLTSSLERRPPNEAESAIMHRIHTFTDKVSGHLLDRRQPNSVKLNSIVNDDTCHLPLKGEKETFLYPLSAFAQKNDGSVDFMNMNASQVSSVQLMQPDHKNVHHKMFGGYLARKAFETSWVCAQEFLQTPVPVLSGVDNIFFRHPVEVGTGIQNVARVVLTTPDEIQIQVDSTMRDPSTGKKTLANLYHFYFKPECAVINNVPHSAQCFSEDELKRPKLVIPQSYEEYLTYLDARRRYLARRSRGL